MLCREVVGHEGIVEDRHTHEALPAAPRKCIVGRQEDNKARNGNQQWDQDKAYRLTTKERPVSLCAVGKPCTAQTMADPEQRGQPEVEDIQRASLRIRISARQPEG